MKRSFQDEFLKAVVASNIKKNDAAQLLKDQQLKEDYSQTKEKNKKPRARRRRRKVSLSSSDEEDDWYEQSRQRKRKESNSNEKDSDVVTIIEVVEEPSPVTEDILVASVHDITSTGEFIETEDPIEQIENIKESSDKTEYIIPDYIVPDLESNHRSSPEMSNLQKKCIVCTTRLNDMAVMKMESNLTPHEILAEIEKESRPTLIKLGDLLEKRNSLDFDILQERISELNLKINSYPTKTAESSYFLQPNMKPFQTINGVSENRETTESSHHYLSVMRQRNPSVYIAKKKMRQHIKRQDGEHIDESNTKQNIIKLYKHLQVMLIDFRKYADSSKSIHPLDDIERITHRVRQNYLRKSILDKLQEVLDPDQVVLISSKPNTLEVFQHDHDIPNTYCIKQIDLPSLCSELTLKFLAQNLKCFGKYVCCWSNRNLLLKKESLLRGLPLQLLEKRHACSNTCGCCETCRPPSTVMDKAISPSIENCTLRDLLTKQRREPLLPPSDPKTLIDRALIFTKRSEMKKNILARANNIMQAAESKLKSLVKKSTDDVIELKHPQTSPTSNAKVEIYEVLNLNGIETFTMLNTVSGIETVTDALNSTKKSTVFNICCWNKRQKIVHYLKARQATQDVVKLIRTKHTCPIHSCVCCCTREVKTNLGTDTESHTQPASVVVPKTVKKAPARKRTQYNTQTSRERKEVTELVKLNTPNARIEISPKLRKNVEVVMKNFKGLRLAIDKDRKVQALLSKVKNIAALSTQELFQLKELLEQAQILADGHKIESGAHLADIMGMNVNSVSENLPIAKSSNALNNNTKYINLVNPLNIETPTNIQTSVKPVIVIDGSTAPLLPFPIPLQIKPNYCIIKMKPIHDDDGVVNLIAKATVPETTVIDSLPIITGVTSLSSDNSSAVLIPNNITPSVSKTSSEGFSTGIIRVRKQLCESEAAAASTSAAVWYKTPENEHVIDQLHDAKESAEYNNMIDEELSEGNSLDAETGEEVKGDFEDDWALATLKKNLKNDIMSGMIDIDEHSISES